MTSIILKTKHLPSILQYGQATQPIPRTFQMPAGSASTSLSITNPLVLYRALVATNKIRADPAQHRLALHLQKLYYRLKDYSPEVEYRYRLDQIARSAPSSPTSQKQNVSQQGPPPSSTSRIRSLFRSSSPSSNLALTKATAIHDSAVSIDSPHGLLLYGEVGRGKSMLLDLLFSTLPSRKKRRWHFNTFMLDIFRRLEQERIFRSGPSLLGLDHEHCVLALAKDTVSTSPIVFLDEFQMPDRGSSKLLNGFMTAFFHLGGVLVASSNRMPDELAKASGMEFSGMGRAGGKGMFGWGMGRLSPGQEAARSDFGLFLEVLKARCEVWEMEGAKDWRRESDDADELDEPGNALDKMDAADEAASSVATSTLRTEAAEPQSADIPRHFHITDPGSKTFAAALRDLNASELWAPTTLTVYSRSLHLANTNGDLGIALCTFASLCATSLGPADYITICSTFHTLILTDVPVLTLLQKNEARRLITLLDALYEAKCRLLVSAEAPPDKLFFPETRRSRSSGLLESRSSDSDAIESEAFSEIYQDSTAPFRPNITMYDERDTSASPTMSIQNSQLRSVLADEDADFGPTYGNGRSHGASIASSVDELHELERRQHQASIGPDFTNLGALIGEDEKFAYKRARSRLWEMCGRKWWREREGDPEEWWMPVGREGNGRFWESVKEKIADEVRGTGMEGSGLVDSSHDGTRRRVDEGASASQKEDSLFRHGASPFRTVSEPPPKFGWQHAWGMMKWGKKAGDWGKGVDGEGRMSQKAGEANKQQKAAPSEKQDK